jgi:hypothetical protein
MATTKPCSIRNRRRSPTSGAKSNTKSRGVIALLDQWMSTPDDLGAERWAAFDKILAEHPVTFRETE